MNKLYLLIALLPVVACCTAMGEPPLGGGAANTRAAGKELLVFGETSGWHQVTLFARVDGVVARWTADIGDHVTQGQILAVIDAPRLDANLAKAKARLDAAQARVAVNKANADFARMTYDRVMATPKGTLPEQQFAAIKSEYEVARAKLDLAKAEVAISEADVNGLVAQTQFKDIKAPFDGVITARHIDIGDQFTVGRASTTPVLYDIADITKIRVFVGVPQADSPRIKIGTVADIFVEGLAGHEFHGVVTRTASAIDPTLRTLRVEVDVANPDALLLPGMYVQVQLKPATPAVP